MSLSLYDAVAIIFYLSATWILVTSLGNDFIAEPVSWRQRLRVLTLGWFAALFHAATLADMFRGTEGINFNFMGASSLASLIIVVILLVTTLTKPAEKLGVIVFPLASIIICLKALLPEDMHVLRHHSWQMNVHILVSMLAYSFLNIAALQAVLVAFQDWHLRTHHPSGLVRSLPPLQTMETLLFQLIGAGFVLLSISLLSGFVFLEDLFAQHLAHKTVLSILAWVVFAVLLGGRASRGWRGQTAIRWTLGGFASLMLAYFGSKMVLEWILKRS